MRARKMPEPQRLQLNLHRDVARRLRRAAARRSLTVRQYVLHAIEDRIHADLSPDTTVMTAATDPVLAELWSNRRDAAYDKL